MSPAFNVNIGTSNSQSGPNLEKELAHIATRGNELDKKIAALSTEKQLELYRACNMLGMGLWPVGFEENSDVSTALDRLAELRDSKEVEILTKEIAQKSE